MNGATTQSDEYKIPSRELGLNGPVTKPKPGTLPLRGDLAHIALAGKHLAAHYVIPERRSIGTSGAALHLLPRKDSEIANRMAPGAAFEVLDVEGDWVWGCAGPDGPSGYCHVDELAPQED
ncbi:MAG: hypothetical protein AAF494_11245 [Pseudomonadota bacterium]